MRRLLLMLNLALGVLLYSLAATPAHGADQLGLFNLQSDRGEHRVRYGYSLWTWTETASRRGREGSQELLGGRVEGRGLAWGRLFFGGRVDLTAGAGEGFTFTQAGLARSVEGAAVGGVALACASQDCLAGGVIAIVGVYGKRWDVSGQQLPDFERPDFYYGAVRVGAGLSYVYAGYGRDAAVDGWHLVLSMHLALPKLRGAGVFTDYQMTDGGTFRYGFSVPVLVGGN
jgi:hypothetical protein